MAEKPWDSPEDAEELLSAETTGAGSAARPTLAGREGNVGSSESNDPQGIRLEDAVLAAEDGLVAEAPAVAVAEAEAVLLCLIGPDPRTTGCAVEAGPVSPSVSATPVKAASNSTLGVPAKATPDLLPAP